MKSPEGYSFYVSSEGLVNHSIDDPVMLESVASLAIDERKEEELAKYIDRNSAENELFFLCNDFFELETKLYNDLYSDSFKFTDLTRVTIAKLERQLSAFVEK